MGIPKEYEKTLKSALNMLAYAECTEAALYEKLIKKGYSSDSVDFAVEYVISKGFLDEYRYLERFVDFLAVKKNFGKRRIAFEVYKKKFDREKASELPRLLEKYDFEEIAFNAAKKLHKPDREKLFASLMRLGHSSSDAGAVCKKMFSAPVDDE